MDKKKCCEIFFQGGKKEKSMGDKKLTDIDIAVALERFSGAIESMQDSQVRIESKLSDLPCDDLLERVVKLEKDKDNLVKDVDNLNGHKESLYQLDREKGIEIATLTQENKGQNFMSDKIWGLIVLFVGAGCSALAYFLTRG